MILRSPSFQEINSSILYYRDDNEYKLDAKAEQAKEDYGLYLKHSTISALEINSYARVKYKAQVYSLLNTIMLKQKREITLELHIDRYRDIHFAAWADAKPAHKAAGFEIKWDANRDNSQKLMVTIDLTKPAHFHYGADLMITYPGKTINGVYSFVLKGLTNN